MPEDLAKLERISRRASDCSIVEPAQTGVGGVDPLGLRQINFDLMNEVFPGLNNVARHIRPFTIVTWAWWRTILLARKHKAKLPVSVHEDYVARIEVAFVWSMLQSYDSGDIDLPGKQRIASIWGGANKIAFGDETWLNFVRARRNSTALTAAVNYGPGLRALRLLGDDEVQPGVRVPGPRTDRLLEAFEAKIRPILKHKLFGGWDACSLKRSTAEEWAEVWDINDLLDEERKLMRDRLIGEQASAARRGGFSLLTHALETAQGESETDLRSDMCEVDDIAFSEEALRWRRVQVRQMFRFALESLFEWIISEIGGGVLKTSTLAGRLLDRVGGGDGPTAGEWLKSWVPIDPSPVNAMDDLQSSFSTRERLEEATLAALALAVLSDPAVHDQSERGERLPITLAAADVARLQGEAPARFLEHVIENWIIAQHTYWSVGRGLADARAGARKIMRLRLVLEPGGWRVTRGRGSRGMPRPTPDRLRTAISLGQESGLLSG